MTLELVAEGVRLEYRRGGALTTALADIDLRITGSEFISIVGPSGCGKSSFLNLVAGFIHPTSGRLLL